MRSVKIFTDSPEKQTGEEQDLKSLQNSGKKESELNELTQEDHSTHANQELVYVYTDTDPMITILSGTERNLTASFHSKDTAGSGQSVGTQVINMSKQNVLSMRREV